VFIRVHLVYSLYIRKSNEKKRKEIGGKALNSAGYPTILTSRTSTVTKHVTYEALTPENQEKKTSLSSPLGGLVRQGPISADLLLAIYTIVLSYGVRLV
jgi:hypothetical protein